MQEFLKDNGFAVTSDYRDAEVVLFNACGLTQTSQEESIEIIKMIRALSSAVESGNNRILRLMRRAYRIEDYRDAILTLKREFPNIQIRTQILVGFPGETEDEFQDTLRLLDEVDFDFVEVYGFQSRPNTEAAGMINQVPQDVIKRRYYKARLISTSIGIKRSLMPKC